jgi:glycosyltransferase involved in cell wall biosynthesis
MFFSILTAAKKALDGEYDLVHANGQEAAIVACMIGLDLDIPVVATYHEQSPEREGYGAGRCRLVYGHLPVDLVIAGSEFYLDKALAFGTPMNRTRKILHGIDLSRFRSRVPVGKTDETRILCLARLKPRKGLLELVTATQRLLEMGHLVSLTIAGTCSSASIAYRDELLRYIQRYGLENNVKIVETVTYDTVPNLVESADLYVQPSFEEGLGLALVEAMAAGLPVVASDIEGIREVVRPDLDGLLVPAGDVDALSNSISKLLQDHKLHHKMSQAALARSVLFDVNRMLDETSAAYADIMAERRHA